MCTLYECEKMMRMTGMINLILSEAYNLYMNQNVPFI